MDTLAVGRMVALLAGGLRHQSEPHPLARVDPHVPAAALQWHAVRRERDVH